MPKDHRSPNDPVPSDSMLRRQARLLQSSYRETVLRLPCGKGPTKTGSKLYGNMLVDGEATGANFLSKEIFEYALQRCNEKNPEETIDRFRLFNNMLSSQPMCFNLFVPLRNAVKTCEQFVSQTFGDLLPSLHIAEVVGIEIEYIPTPIKEYTNDCTAFDAFVEYRTKEGKKGCIGIETKYVDKLGANDPADMDRKHHIAIEAGCFTAEGLASIRRRCPQIIRNILLTEKYRINNGYDESMSLILSPAEHSSSEREIESIRRILSPKHQDKIASKTLEEFVEAIRGHCPPHRKKWIGEFYRRYLDFDSVNH